MASIPAGSTGNPSSCVEAVSLEPVANLLTRVVAQNTEQSRFVQETFDISARHNTNPRKQPVVRADCEA